MVNMLTFVDHLECPTVNGIIYPSGIIQLVDAKSEWSHSEAIKLVPAGQTSIAKLEENDNLEWNSCAVLDRTVNEKENLEVLTGECAFGSEGFVALLEFTTQKLIWLAFFTDSNPFIHPRIERGLVYATSTLNCKWRFDFKEPANIQVECYKFI
ncbi:MAG: hypothetical protein ABIU63_17750 [Chitinophagaceae bacterium]